MTSREDRPRTAIKVAATIGVVLIFVGFIALTEFVLRTIGLGEPLLYYDTVASYRYALRHEQSTERFRGAVVSIDQYGLRTTEDWGREDAELRILFIGDSVTYGGSHINNNELFSAQVCEQLARERNIDAVCGNAGVNNYGTDNMTGRIGAYDGPPVDVMVVTVLSSDPLRGEVQLRALPFFAVPPWQPVPAIVEAAAFVLEGLRRDIRFPRGAGSQFDKEKEEASGRAVAAESLARLYAALREVAADGVSVLLVHTPPRRSVEEGYDALDEFVIENMKASGFPFLEMSPVLQGAVIDNVFSDIIHLEVEGHSIYGAAIAEKLISGF